VERLIIATNRNDVLHRMLSTGHCDRQALEHSLSPSMDITVSSNFERLLFDLYQRDGAAVAELMPRLEAGDVDLSSAAMAEARILFSSQSVSDDETCAQIASTWQDCEYLLDPHSAIGLKAALESGLNPEIPVVTLATAHPAKFPDALKSAGLSQEPALPPHLGDLFERPERVEVLANDLSTVHAFMAHNINA
jgi:threonine synthase